MPPIIGPVPESYRRMPEPWRVIIVRHGNDPKTRAIFDPRINFHFVNEDTAKEPPFTEVAIEEADQLTYEEARARLGSFALASLKDAFLLVPPEGFDFEQAYKPTIIVAGELL